MCACVWGGAISLTEFDLCRLTDVLQTQFLAMPDYKDT